VSSVNLYHLRANNCKTGYYIAWWLLAKVFDCMMESNSLHLSTGVGISIFYTLFLGSALVIMLVWGTKLGQKPAQIYFICIGIPLLLLAMYRFTLFWTTIKVSNTNALVIELKTIFGTNAVTYQEVESVELRLKKGGYVLYIKEKGNNVLYTKGGYTRSNAQKIVTYFEGTSLPFHTNLFSK
jgi:hypothetical protein